MNKLNLKNINRQAPYTVHEREEKQHEFYFWSDFGIVYDISFAPNDSIIPSGAIEIGINNREQRVSPRDPKLLKTLTVIIEEFFACNDDVMLYLAETGDGKQKFRNRLFIIWFNNYENRHKFILKTPEGKMDGQDNFMALIAQIDNPRLAQAIKEFEETADILFGTPTRKPFSLLGKLKKCFYKLFASQHNSF